VNLLQAAPFQAQIVYVPPVDRSWTAHRLRRYLALTRSAFSALPAKICFLYSRHMLASVKRLLREQDFDIILINGSDLLWLLPHLPSGTPTVLCAHNIEHHLYAAQIEDRLPVSRFLKSILLRDCARLRRYELEGLRNVGNAVFVSQEDEAYARAVCPDLNTLTLPPLFDERPTPRLAGLGATAGIEIGMLANFEWWPSQNGLRWFLGRVFSGLHPGIRLHLFGKRSLTVVPDHPRVVKHGYVKSLDEVWSTCHFMICPVLAGGGVSIKLAEAVCRGVPVLATRYATRGLPLDPDPAIVLRDSPEDWVEFLNSDAARELRWRSPSRQIVVRFLPDHHIAGVSRFLDTVMVDPASSRCAARPA
jgi:hypothetical protein